MYIGYDDTICAPATVPGTGAITVIRISGPKALDVADRVVTCAGGAAAGAESGGQGGLGVCPRDNGHSRDSLSGLVGICP